VRLNGVATYIGAVGLSVAAAVLVVLIVRYHTYDLANELLLFFLSWLFF
jgi:tryptophan-rich sensory protein